MAIRARRLSLKRSLMVDALSWNSVQLMLLAFPPSFAVAKGGRRREGNGTCPNFQSCAEKATRVARRTVRLVLSENFVRCIFEIDLEHGVSFERGTNPTPPRTLQAPFNPLSTSAFRGIWKCSQLFTFRRDLEGELCAFVLFHDGGTLVGKFGWFRVDRRNANYRRRKCSPDECWSVTSKRIPSSVLI